MNCPRLPTLPSSTVSRIDPSWFRDLYDCLRYAMTHPAGDGVTIFNDAGGTLRADLAGGGESGATAETSPVESSGYCGEFKVSVGEIVRSEEENSGEIISLELFIRNGLALYGNNSNPPAGWITLAGKRVAKTPAYQNTFYQGGEYELSCLYVWHRVAFNVGIMSSFVFTSEDEMPEDETESETTFYTLLAVIRDGQVCQAHYGPINITDRYYDDTVTE